MDDSKEVIEEVVEEKVEPLEVKVVNTEKKVVTAYDDTEDLEYENLYPTEEQIKEFEDGDSQRK